MCSRPPSPIHTMFSSITISTSPTISTTIILQSIFPWFSSTAGSIFSNPSSAPLHLLLPSPTDSSFVGCFFPFHLYLKRAPASNLIINLIIFDLVFAGLEAVHVKPTPQSTSLFTASILEGHCPETATMISKSAVSPKPRPCLFPSQVEFQIPINHNSPLIPCLISFCRNHNHYHFRLQLLLSKFNLFTSTVEPVLSANSPSPWQFSIGSIIHSHNHTCKSARL